MTQLDPSTTHRMADGHRQQRIPNDSPASHDSLANQPDGARKRNGMPDDKVSYLKVLVMSLLREIESLEGTVGDESNEDANLQGEVRRFEAELIRCALVRTGGRQRRAARLLGTKVTTLNTKIKRYKIRIGDPEIQS